MAIKRQRAIQNAEKYIRRGKLEAAISEYRKVLKETPNDTSTLNRVGDLYVRLDRLDRAVDLFVRAADHFANEGFFVKAIAIYKKIIRVDPTRIAVYETLADLYNRQGLTTEARGQYQVVADYYAQTGDTPRVIGLHLKLVELEPENPSHRVRLAELYREANRVPEAVDQYREIASLMLQHGSVQEAARVYQKALELDSSDLGFITDAVLEIRDRGDAEAAERLLETAIERNSEAATVRELVGLPSIQKPSPVPEVEAPVAHAPAAADREEVEEPAVEAVDEPVEDEEVVVLDLDQETEGVPFSAEPLDVAAVEEEPGEAAAPAEPAVVEAATDIEFEIELDELEALVAEEAAAEAPARQEPIESEAPTAPPEAVEPPAREPEPEPEDTAAKALELLAEANVLANYGLDEKAVERFEQVLSVDLDNLEARRRLIDLHIEGGRLVEAGRLGEEIAGRASSAEWEPIRERLLEAGFRVSGLAVLPPEEIEAPIEVETAAAEEPSTTEAAAPEAVEEAVEIDTPEAAEVEPEAAGAAGDIDWLEEPATEAGAADEDLYDAEEDFFDLAAELEEELREEEAKLGQELLPRQMQEQSLEEIVEGFKKGVAEILGPEDYDTHYNLGIAYREMGLLDEAIGEFQMAAKDPRYLVDCCSLLGTCFLEKGFLDLAVKWYRRGLESPTVTDGETLGLLYELGNAYLAAEDRKAAHETFVEIYGMNANYRDVVAKLEELRSRD